MDSVTHELKVLEELPPRRTLLNDQLSVIARNAEWYGKPIQIGSYAKMSAANGAKHLLQKRWGKTPNEHGWTFATRGVVEEGEKRTALIAIFTPEMVNRSMEPSVPSGHARPKRVTKETAKKAAPQATADSTKSEPKPETPVEASSDKELPSNVTPELLERLAKVPNLDEILESLGA